MSHRVPSASCDFVCPRLHRTKMSNLNTKSAVKKTEGPQSTRSMASPPNRKASSSRQLSKSPRQESLLHRELFSGNGIVELTVKPHKSKPKQQHGNHAQKQTWGKVLKQQTHNENISQFNHFDPLNTIHFLAKELHNKVQKVLPNDNSIKQMLNEMQKALTRLPPDVANKLIAPAHLNNDFIPEKLPSGSQKPSFVESSNVPPKVNHESSQTPRNIFMEPEKLQKHIEESSEKIEGVCRQMEALCTKLKSDNIELEQKLSAEQETVKYLNKDLEEQKTKFNVTTALIQSLQIKNGELEEQLEILKDSKQTGPSQEIKDYIQELQQEKVNFQEECLNLKHELTLLNMEKTKFETILKARDIQVREIRSEMSQLQDAVASQLMELKVHSNSSAEDVTLFNNEAPGHESNMKMPKMENDKLSGDHEDNNSRTCYSSDSNFLLPEAKPSSNVTLFKKRRNDDLQSTTSVESLSTDKNIFDKFSEVKNKALASINLKNK